MLFSIDCDDNCKRFSYYLIYFIIHEVKYKLKWCILEYWSLVEGDK